MVTPLPAPSLRGEGEAGWEDIGTRQFAAYPSIPTVCRPILLVFLVTLAGCEIRTTTWQTSSHHLPQTLDMTLDSQVAALEGTWHYSGIWPHDIQAHQNSWLNLRLKDPHENWMFGTSISNKDIRGTIAVEADGKVESTLQFTIQRQAGRIEFQGVQKSKLAEGAFDIKPDPELAPSVTALTGKTPTSRQLLSLLLIDTTPAYINALQNTGWRISMPDLTQLASQRIDLDYIRAIQKAFPGITVSEVVRLRNFGIKANDALAFKEAGYEFRAEEVIRCRQFGISGSQAAEFRKSGLDLKAEELVRLRQFGVAADFAAAAHQAGYGSKIEDIVRLRQFGLTPDYLKTLKAAEYHLTTEEIIRLRNLGISAEYLKDVKQLGYQFSVEEIIKLRNFGVSIDYLKAIQIPGRPPLQASAILEMRQRGVSPESVRAMRQ